ncbi:MAG: hypothetical protein IKC09_01165 [Oscillospiraceae bacterium]|nr:hypothetical protein [Oscillospiraceae bacterium]
MTQSERNGYFRQIRGWLPCSRRLKNQILEPLEASVDEFIQKNPDANLAQIQAHFGTPEQIAAACVDEMDPGVLIRDLRVRRRVVAIVSAVAAFVVATWLGVVGWAIVNELNHVNGTIVYEGIGYGQYVEEEAQNEAD